MELDPIYLQYVHRAITKVLKFGRTQREFFDILKNKQVYKDLWMVAGGGSTPLPQTSINE